eukprot:scaffold1085_cov252-Pinguiococcus_pyrenoidosus.AAC.12
MFAAPNDSLYSAQTSESELRQTSSPSARTALSHSGTASGLARHRQATDAPSHDGRRFREVWRVHTHRAAAGGHCRVRRHRVRRLAELAGGFPAPRGCADAPGHSLLGVQGIRATGPLMRELSWERRVSGLWAFSRSRQQPWRFDVFVAPKEQSITTILWYSKPARDAVDVERQETLGTAGGGARPDFCGLQHPGRCCPECHEVSHLLWQQNLSSFKRLLLGIFGSVVGAGYGCALLVSDALAAPTPEPVAEEARPDLEGDEEETEETKMSPTELYLAMGRKTLEDWKEVARAIEERKAKGAQAEEDQTKS